jgi:hypothetical protein
MMQKSKTRQPHGEGNLKNRYGKTESKKRQDGHATHSRAGGRAATRNGFGLFMPADSCFCYLGAFSGTVIIAHPLPDHNPFKFHP